MYTYPFEENSSCYDECCYGRKSEQSYHRRNKDIFETREKLTKSSKKSLKAYKWLENSKAC